MAMTSASVPAEAVPQPGRWAMAVRGFLCQNVSVGCAFGGFGVAVGEIKAQYAVSMGLASMGLALAVLTMGLVSPLVARMIGHFGLRRTMLTGLTLSGLGYVALAFAPNIYVVLAAFGLLIGIGIAMFGPFPASVLASNWFQPNAGGALGFVNMPVMVALVPLLGVALIKTQGLPTFFLALAGIHVLLVPVVLGVIDAPPGTAAGGDAQGHGANSATSARAILTRPVFWAVVVGAGCLSAAGIVGISHIVAFATERGLPDADAALLLSIMGGASIIGSLLAGIIANRIGSANTLALIGALIAGGWAVLYATSFYPLLLMATLVLGACGAGVFPAVNMLGAQIFGVSALARVIGLFTLCTLPMNFLLPPAAGVLRDHSVNYNPVIVAIIAMAAVIMALFLVTARAVASRRAAPEAAPA